MLRSGGLILIVAGLVLRPAGLMWGFNPTDLNYIVKLTMKPVKLKLWLRSAELKPVLKQKAD